MIDRDIPSDANVDSRLRSVELSVAQTKGTLVKIESDLSSIARKLDKRPFNVGWAIGGVSIFVTLIIFYTSLTQEPLKAGLNQINLLASKRADILAEFNTNVSLNTAKLNFLIDDIKQRRELDQDRLNLSLIHI